MKQSTPFRRANLFIAAISALLTKGVDMQSAISTVGHYRSRGHGKGKYSGKKPGNKSGRTYAANGKKECARRLRQMANNQLQFHHQ